MIPASSPGNGSHPMRLRMQDIDHYEILCDKNYMKQLEQEIKTRYEVRRNDNTSEFRLDGTKINGENEASC